MLNKQKHRLHLANLLKKVYKHPFLSTVLGFKGGTAAYLLYDLPRFSVDLDFDLLNKGDVKKTYNTLLNLFDGYQIKDSYQKHNTLFYLLSYGEDERNIKFEISTRESKSKFDLSESLGVSMQIMQKPSMFANKLLALSDRKKPANRDIFDVHFFAENKWGIDEEVIVFRNGNSVQKELDRSLNYLKNIEPKNRLSGLGELVSDRQKEWVRQHLLSETIELLEGYKFAYKE